MIIQKKFISSLYWRSLEVSPLAIFLILMAWFDSTASNHWGPPYFISSFFVLMSTMLLFKNKFILNRIFIGINLYLLSGSLGQLLHWQSLNLLYGELQAAGMLLWIFLVGIASTLFSSLGFIGIEVLDTNSSKTDVSNQGTANPTTQYQTHLKLVSLILILVTLASAIFSFYFRGDKILSEIIPFMALFATQAALRRKYLSSISNQPSSHIKAN